VSVLLVAVAVATPPLRAQQDAETIQKLKAQLEAAQRTAKDAEVSLKKALAEIERLKGVEVTLTKTIEEHKRAVRDVQADLDKERIKSFGYKKLAESSNEEQTAFVMELLDRCGIRRLGESPRVDGAPKLPYPPLGSITGRIDKVDAMDRRLVQLSIGTDDGAYKNNTLEVYRLKPRPLYLGQVRIVDASPNSSVGRLIVPPGGKIPDVQAGDQVASGIPEVLEKK
jgi:hypothetical protein